MKFKFAFETLLDHKKTLEDIARKDWAIAQRRVDEANSKLETFYQEVESARARATQIEIEGGKRSSDLVLINDFLIGQKTRIERQRILIRDLMSEAERLQEILVEASRERKTFEKLKENQHTEFKKAKKKRELKLADDLVTMRFAKAVSGK